MIRKSLLAAGLLLLAFSILFIYSPSFQMAILLPKRANLKIPVSLATKGAVFEAVFDPGKITDQTIIYTASLNFTTVSVDGQNDSIIVSKLLRQKDYGSGYSREIDGTWIQNRVGIWIPVRLTIRKASNDGTLKDYYDNTINQLIPFASSVALLMERIDYVKLPPAKYLVRLEILDSVPQLAQYPVVFEIGTHGK